jgi:hypothetical protein
LAQRLSGLLLLDAELASEAVEGDSLDAPLAALMLLALPLGPSELDEAGLWLGELDEGAAGTGFLPNMGKAYQPTRRNPGFAIPQTRHRPPRIPVRAWRRLTACCARSRRNTAMMRSGSWSRKSCLM